MDAFIMQQSFVAIEAYAVACLFTFAAMFGTVLAVYLIFLLIEKVMYRKHKD
jgi:hypothetical protein